MNNQTSPQKETQSTPQGPKLLNSKPTKSIIHREYTQEQLNLLTKRNPIKNPQGAAHKGNKNPKQTLKTSRSIPRYHT
jgi:hypothetical protein